MVKADNPESAASSEDELKVTAYASAYLQAYAETIDRYYADVLQELINLGVAVRTLPLYGRRLGVDVGATAAITGCDFYMFFIDAAQTPMVRLKQQPEQLDTVADVRNWLDLRSSELAEPVIMEGGDFSRFDTEYWEDQARSVHGPGAGRRDGDRAAAALPRLLGEHPWHGGCTRLSLGPSPRVRGGPALPGTGPARSATGT